MINNKDEAKKILKEFINKSNSNWGWLINDYDLSRFINFTKFCLYNKVSFSEDDFLFIFKNEIDWLWEKYKKSDIKKLYEKYIEYKNLFRALDEAS